MQLPDIEGYTWRVGVGTTGYHPEIQRHDDLLNEEGTAFYRLLGFSRHPQPNISKWHLPAGTSG